MPVDERDLMNAIAEIADEQNVRVTLEESGKGALMCAACSFIGGMLLGPVGLAIGGVVGGLAAYNETSGSFRPLGEVILNDLNDNQQKRLVWHVSNLVNEMQPGDAAKLLPLLLNNKSIQKAVLKRVITFVSNELQIKIVY